MSRLIEAGFPLEAVSIDSVHEKNVRHGHLSTLHIWPARRPLAASRAVLAATLLPDPGSVLERSAIFERLAGTVVETVTTGKNAGGDSTQRRKRVTHGGVLHWGRENEPALGWLRKEISRAFDGRAPKVLDPFAGGGAIPLEAMRLGCEVVASDINPVAWLILKCTLDYPCRLGGERHALPDFALEDREFMEKFRASFLPADHRSSRSTGKRTRAGTMAALPMELAAEVPQPDANLAWQVRAWGGRVLAKARRALAKRYPTYAEFQALMPGSKPDAPHPPERLPPDASGECDAGPLNQAFTEEYLADPRNPRWVAKPTVAYLWTRTVKCKHCRAVLPLLKTRWLCKTNRKIVLLTMAPRADGTGVDFGVAEEDSGAADAAAQRRVRQPQTGTGTMSRSGAACPCCSMITTMADIRAEGKAGRLGAVMTAVVVDGPKGKEYRRPTKEDIAAADVAATELEALYSGIPFGLPDEPTPQQGAGASRAFSVGNYGFDQWQRMFTPRQLLALGTFVRETRCIGAAMAEYPQIWREAVAANLALCIGRLADYSSAFCMWGSSRETIGHTFTRFALPIVWDFAEVNPLSDSTGGYAGGLEWVSRALDHLVIAGSAAPPPRVLRQSAMATPGDGFDLICTDPPYYDAIPYSDLMDFFLVWQRRVLHGSSHEFDAVYAEPLGPKWDTEANDGELIDDASRFGGDRERSRRNYEDGMACAFSRCHQALNPDGRLVVVFANKQPEAWETLVAALIRAGFVVDASWPILTEMQSRPRAVASAALASSVWLVCRKRPPGRPGWDGMVRAEMRENIVRKLREFWDAGIRGPDFVWAATGPALESFSRFPAVRKADEPDSRMTVSEFLGEVRRMVVDFVVGRVLSGGDDGGPASGLDDVTTYYLLHRADFGMEAAPMGSCILYALSCNLSDNDLRGSLAILSQALAPSSTENGDPSERSEGGSGGKARLNPWRKRNADWIGRNGVGGRPVALIDRVHRLMHLWAAGDETKVNRYLAENSLERDALFARVLQALIELAAPGSDERAILESVSNHISTRTEAVRPRKAPMQFGVTEP